MFEGSGHRYQGRYNSGQTVNNPRATRLLGEQNRKTSYCPLQGHREVWFGFGPIDTRTPRDGNCGRSGSEEAPEHGRNRGLLHFGPRIDLNPGELREGYDSSHSKDLFVSDPRLVA